MGCQANPLLSSSYASCTSERGNSAFGLCCVFAMTALVSHGSSAVYSYPGLGTGLELETEEAPCSFNGEKEAFG